jgi:hypothetical protein
MANSPVPSLSTGNTVTAANWDTLPNLNTFVGLLGATSAKLNGGTVPTQNAPNFQLQAGVTTVSITSGTGTIAFPQTFPNGLLAFVGFIDNAGGCSQVCYNGAGGSTTAAISVEVFGSTGSHPSNGNQIITWIAIGY